MALNQDNESNLDQFIAGKRCDSSGAVHLTELDKVCDCLTPAACYHFYIHFQGQDLIQPLFLTTRAHCFRREKFYAPLERQWAFNMREIVCIGSHDEVKNFISTFRANASEIFKKLDLDINWEIATDPFFNPESNAKYVMQQLDPVKHEMILNQHLSIGSTNFHKDYFGENFNISYQGQVASSACMAFGLERWLYAIVDRYGVNPKNWPLAEIQNV